MMKPHKEFLPTEHNPLPWKVKPGACGIWNGVKDVNGKTVCNCRNIKDAEFIVRLANKELVVPTENDIEDAAKYIMAHPSVGNYEKAIELFKDGIRWAI